MESKGLEKRLAYEKKDKHKNIGIDLSPIKKRHKDLEMKK